MNISTCVLCEGFLWPIKPNQTIKMLLLITILDQSNTSKVSKCKIILVDWSSSLSRKVISTSNIFSVGTLWILCSDWGLKADKKDSWTDCWISHFQSLAGLCWSSISVASCSDALFLPYVCFSVHSAHALQLLDARRTKVCPYVCTTCWVHNIESPSVWRVFSDTWQSLCTITTSSPVNLRKEGNYFWQFTLSPFPVDPHIFLYKPWNYKKVISLFNCVNPNVSGAPSPCCTTNRTAPDCLWSGFDYSVIICVLSSKSWLGHFLDIWLISLWRYLLEENINGQDQAWVNLWQKPGPNIVSLNSKPTPLHIKKYNRLNREWFYLFFYSGHTNSTH